MGVIAREFSRVVGVADTNSYSTVQWLVANVHEGLFTGQTMRQVMAVFQELFNKAPPTRVELLDWEKCVFALESVTDRLQSRRKTMHLKLCSSLFPSNILQWSQHGNDHHNLVCHNQQCKTTWTKTWMCGHITWLSWMICRMSIWIGTMTWAVQCWTHSQVLYPAQRFFLATNMPSIAVWVTEMRCSGQRKISYFTQQL